MLSIDGSTLCRTEHMFLGDRRVLIERLVLADSAAARGTALETLLQEMDGLPVTIRLLDPPLHEFLPDRTELAVRVAVARAGSGADPVDERLLAAMERLHESNPMLGLRGVRLGLVVPGLYGMQVRAVAEAAAECVQQGGRPLVEITAHRIAEAAEFFSFGTNDLTQTTWGFPRDDVEAAIFAAYLDKGVFTVSPFESLDRDGVGALIRTAVAAGRKTRPDLKLGICGGTRRGPRVGAFLPRRRPRLCLLLALPSPVARLEAGRAALFADTADSAF